MNPKKRILVVDDDSGNRTVMAEFLTQRGYTVETAANGAEAAGTLEQDDAFDVVISDIEMPVMNGIDLGAFIIFHFPAIRTIFVSGRELADLEATYDLEGVVHGGNFMQKPVRFVDLLEKIEADAST